MKVGFILECSPKGPDAIIYPYLAKKLCPDIAIMKPETLINKANVMNDGPIVAQTLLETGCDHVFIIWDRMPKWGGTGKCEEHTATLQAGLKLLNIDLDQITLCCISDMLESWLIADGRGIDNWLAQKTNHAIKSFGDHKTNSEQTEPKDRIKKFLSENYRKWKYNDYEDNFAIVQHLPDLERVAKWNQSFAHFKEGVDSICY